MLPSAVDAVKQDGRTALTEAFWLSRLALADCFEKVFFDRVYFSRTPMQMSLAASSSQT